MIPSKNKIVIFFFLATTIVAVKGQQSPNNLLARPCLYAPHREAYNNEAKEKPNPTVTECVFCADINDHDDPKNFVIARFKHNAIFLNLFPQGKGQILIIPNDHVESLEGLCPAARTELMAIITAAPKILREVLHSQGTNVGINLGKIAGASKPDHLHIHVLPRYENESNAYLENLCETLTIQWDLKELYKQLRPAFEKLKTKLAQECSQYAEKANTYKTMKEAVSM